VITGLVIRLGLPSLWTPIHEEMHVVAVQMTGGQVTERGFDFVSYARSSSPEFVRWAGAGLEVIFYGLLSLLVPVGFIAHGAVWALGIWVMVSADFERVGQTGWILFYVFWLAAVCAGIARGVKWWKS